MNDLAILLNEKQIEINEFFEISSAEKKDSRAVYCNIELSFDNDIELPVFSDKTFEYMKIQDFECSFSSSRLFKCESRESNTSWDGTSLILCSSSVLFHCNISLMAKILKLFSFQSLNSF